MGKRLSSAEWIDLAGRIQGIVGELRAAGMGWAAGAVASTIAMVEREAGAAAIQEMRRAKP